MHGSELTAYCLALAGLALVLLSLVPMLLRPGFELQTWRQLADRGLTGAALCLAAGIVAFNARLSPITVWVILAVAIVTGVYFAAKRGQPRLATAVPVVAKRDPDTGVMLASPQALAMLTRGKLPFMTQRKPSLRDGTCPLCDHTTVIKVERKDTRFTTHVCAACGYAQDFADLAKL